MPVFTFGAIADVQYADIPDGSNWDKSRIRYYRGALDILNKAVDWWKQEGVDFMMNLADVIDGHNKPKGIEESSLESVLAAFGKIGKDVPLYSMVGNHEYANFTHEQLASKPYLSDGLNYDFSPKAGWRIVVVNTYEHNVILADNRDYAPPLPTDDRYTLCLQALLAKNPNLSQGEATWHSGIAWGKDLSKEVARYLPYNGMVGTAQLGWVRGVLEKARAAGERVIVTGHSPYLMEAATPNDLALDCDEMLALLSEYSSTVALVLSGHSHDGGFAQDPATGISHITLPSPLETSPEIGHCDALFKVYSNRIEITGRGRATSHTVELK